MPWRELDTLGRHQARKRIVLGRGWGVLVHLPALVRILESYVLEHPDQWELWTRI